jgi:uncharacterized membrane protein
MIGALIVSFGLGFVGGLRSMTPLAVVAWASRIGWMNLSNSRLAFMGSGWAVALFTLAALGEYVADLLPTTPARTAPFPLTVRIVVGLLTGACVAIAGGFMLWVGVLGGAMGAIAGAFGGYRARVGLVRALHVPDAVIAIPEDVVAIGLGLLLAYTLK